MSIKRHEKDFVKLEVLIKSNVICIYSQAQTLQGHSFICQNEMPILWANIKGLQMQCILILHIPTHTSN